jgi:hypothetical protein
MMSIRLTVQPLRKLFALMVVGRVWITISLLLSSSAGTVIHGKIIIAWSPGLHALVLRYMVLLTLSQPCCTCVW